MPLISFYGFCDLMGILEAIRPIVRCPIHITFSFSTHFSLWRRHYALKRPRWYRPDESISLKTGWFSFRRVHSSPEGVDVVWASPFQSRGADIARACALTRFSYSSRFWLQGKDQNISGVCDDGMEAAMWHLNFVKRQNVRCTQGRQKIRRQTII